MYLNAEKDRSTSQDVTGAYLNRGIIALDRVGVAPTFSPFNTELISAILFENFWVKVARIT